MAEIFVAAYTRAGRGVVAARTNDRQQPTLRFF
jgi:hypothetical protein